VIFLSVSSVLPAIRRFGRKCAETFIGLLTFFFKWNPKEMLIAGKDYFQETGQWYLGSAAVHALALILLGLISMISPGVVVRTGSDAPSFNATEEEISPPPTFTRFEVGEAPLDPTELNTDTLTQFEAKPIGGQTAIYYDESPDFVEAGGGSATDLTGPQLGGLGGFSVKDLPGPAGKGGVGVGAGLGDKPGVGGQGEGFGGRGRGHREALAGAFGGTKASERAVGAALNWIHRHQTSYGKWSLDFRQQCKNGVCTGAGTTIRSDEAATALALLPFLAAGQTHKSKGPYQQTVSKGIAWLMKQQTPEGCLFGNSDQPMYAQGLATLALCEAYGMSKDERVGAAARKAVAFIERAQNPSTGGWRYYPGDPGDTSVTGWQVMALKSGQLAGLPVNSLVFDNTQKWLRSVAKGPHLGMFAYQPYREVTPPMTAVGMLCTQYLGIDRNAPPMIEGKQYLLENMPDDKLMRNTYYWYYATLTMHNFAGPEWDAWNRKMRRILILSQEKEGCATGSWNPLEPSLDVWGEQGGRLMTTSLNALTLEIYYRYLPIFRTDTQLPEAQPKPKENKENDVKKDTGNEKDTEGVMPE
jgi:hypothetical protein